MCLTDTSSHGSYLVDMVRSCERLQRYLFPPSHHSISNSPLLNCFQRASHTCYLSPKDHRPFRSETGRLMCHGFNTSFHLLVAQNAASISQLERVHITDCLRLHQASVRCPKLVLTACIKSLNDNLGSGHI